MTGEQLDTDKIARFDLSIGTPFLTIQFHSTLIMYSYLQIFMFLAILLLWKHLHKGDAAHVWNLLIQQTYLVRMVIATDEFIDAIRNLCQWIQLTIKP